MYRKSLIAAAALALTVAALAAAPAWLVADETPAEKSAAPTTRGHLGVGLRGLTAELQRHFGVPEGSGVLVASVADESPAAAAGIRVGDVITAVDGLAVDSSRDLSREVRHRPGETVEIELYRDQRRLVVSAVLGERSTRHGDHRDWSHAGRTPEEWAEFAESWERWGEELGERWGRWGEELGETFGESFGESFGERFGESWGEEHAESWQRWAEEMAESGEDWGEMGEEVGRAVEKALAEVDWDEIGRSVERSMEALEGIDWEGIGAEIESHMEEVERRLDERREPDTGSE